MKLRALFGTMVVLSALFAFAIPAWAGNQGSCGGDSTFVRLYENQIGDTSNGDDTLLLCSSNANLSNVVHTLGGICNAPIKADDDWNDCIGGFKPFLPQTSDYRVCLYSSPNYAGSVNYLTGNMLGFLNRRDTWSPLQNDTASSIWFGAANFCP